MKQVINHAKMKRIRRKLRNNLTPAEATLWLSLKNKQLAGRKFRRQVSFSSYIVDFYCPKEKLVIELDGLYHDMKRRKAYEKKREVYLKNLGLKVIRFRNPQVYEELEEVLKMIKACFNPPCVPHALDPSQSPLRSGEKLAGDNHRQF